LYSHRETDSNEEERRWKRSHRVQRDEPKRYIILAKDYTNDEETKKTRDFLNSKMSDQNVYVYEFTKLNTSHIQAWGGMTFTDAAKAEVEAYSGVKTIEEVGTGDEERVLPPSGEPQRRNITQGNGTNQKSNIKRSLS
jgi:asparagine N-glycosylation enzyme membrane subunit Stt3